MSLEFIFMLTENDKTVSDAHKYLKTILAGGVKHIGFKDIGLPFNELSSLAQAIREAGAILYLEIVSLDEKSEIKSAKIAMALNVDFLIGGTRPNIIAPLIKEHKLKYYPFPGNVIGYPSILDGTIEAIVDSAITIASIDGVDGLDLLAYRFVGDVPLLINTVCAAVSIPVIVAGSINSKEQIETIYKAGAVGFTIGTAAFHEDFPAKRSGLFYQISSITLINNQINSYDT